MCLCKDNERNACSAQSFRLIFHFVSLTVHRYSWTLKMTDVGVRGSLKFTGAVQVRPLPKQISCWDTSHCSGFANNDSEFKKQLPIFWLGIRVNHLAFCTMRYTLVPKPSLVFASEYHIWIPLTLGFSLKKGEGRMSWMPIPCGAR